MTDNTVSVSNVQILPPQSQSDKVDSSPSLKAVSHHRHAHHHHHHTQPVVREEPTLTEHRPFDPRKDAEAIHEAMRGLGTHENTIIDILARRTNKQRRDIAFFYKEQYGKEIVKAFKGELKILLSGHFEDVILALLKTPAEYDAETIHHAISGLSTDTDVLIDIICSRDGFEYEGIKSAYQVQYGKDLMHDIEGHVHSSAYFKTMLLAILTTPRDAEDTVNEKQARWDARAMFDVGPKSWAKETTLIPIFAGRSFNHLKLVFNQFEILADMPIDSVLGHDLHGDTSHLLQSLVNFTRDKITYFADLLHHALTKLGSTNHKLLIRTIVSRSEHDLGTIKKRFQARHSKSLASVIEHETHGAYRNILLALSGCTAGNA